MGLEVHDTPPATKPGGAKNQRARGEAPVTFSQQVIAAAARTERGDWEVMGMARSVGVRMPKGGDAMRLARILSAEDAAKPAVFNQCLLAFCVTEIDGEAVPRPANGLQIEVILDRLGLEGMGAASEAFGRFGQGPGNDDAKN